MSNKDIHPLIVIPRCGKRRVLSDQAQKDQGLTANRVRLNKDRINSVVNRLEYLLGQSPQKKDLLQLARQLCCPCGIALDRLAKRSRDCLICWYCENWAVIEPIFSSLCATQPRGAYDSRNSCSCPAPAKIASPGPANEPVVYEDFAVDFDFPVNDFLWAPALEASHVPDVDEFGGFF